jgi:phage tail P2-like protein
MSTPSLLPPASTTLERALDLASGTRMEAIPQVTHTAWNAATCPAQLLPHLALAVSVDEWDEVWTDPQKRAAILAAPEVHNTKGTPAAILRALTSLGQPDATVTERSDFIRCDGSVTCDGSHTCGGQWATYTVTLHQPVSIAEANLTHRTLESVGRNCVQLMEINFAEVAYRCDGSITCDGTVSCGAVAMTLN